MSHAAPGGHRAGRQTDARSEGHSRAGGRGPRAWGVVALVLVVLTGVGLWYAAGAPASDDVTRATGVTETVASRTLTCAGDIDGAVRLSRTSAAPDSKPIGARSLSLPIPAHNAAAESTGYAVRTATGKSWLAYAQCPQPRSSWWFVGAGSSSSHASTLTLDNPRPGDAVVDVDVLGPKGAVDAPGLRGLPVPSNGSRTLSLADVAPSTGEIAVHVTATRGLVSASLSEKESPDLVTKPVSEWVPDQREPARVQTLTGLPVKPSSATLLVANPGDTDAVVSVRAIGSGGTFSPQGASTLTVTAGSVGHLPVTKTFDGKPAAITVSSRTPVTASVRSVVGADETYAGSTTSLRGSVAAGIPERAKATVLLSSPGTAGSATVTPYDGQGKALKARDVKVAAGVSVGADLPAATRYVVVTAGAGSLAAGLTLAGSPGVAGAALAPVEEQQRVPGVVPAG